MIVLYCQVDMDQYLLNPINTIFKGMNIIEYPFTSYFDVHQGYKGLTHCLKWFLGSVDPISAGPGWRCDRIPDPQCAVVERAVVKGRAAVGLELGGGYEDTIYGVCGCLREVTKLTWGFIRKQRKNGGFLDPPKNSSHLKLIQKLFDAWNWVENCCLNIFCIFVLLSFTFLATLLMIFSGEGGQCTWRKIPCHQISRPKNRLMG